MDILGNLATVSAEEAALVTRMAAYLADRVLLQRRVARLEKLLAPFAALDVRGTRHMSRPIYATADENGKEHAITMGDVIRARDAIAEGRKR